MAILGLTLMGTGRQMAWGDPIQILPGHVPAAVAHLSPTRNLPATNRMNLAIGIPLRHTAALDEYLAQLANPASPNYRHYLTPQQFAAQFGPTEQDYQAVMAFARSNNLAITATHGNRLLLDVSGRVADIQQAFHVTLREYHHPTEPRDFYAPDTEPTVDSRLRMADISGLNNFALPHPKLHRDDARALASGAAPRSGSGTGGAYAGNDFRSAYLPGVTLTGTGQQLGLLEFDGYYASDISRYESAYGLPAVPLQTVLLDGYDGVPTTGSSSGNPEVSLDIEMAACMAPGLARMVVFEAGPNGLPNDLLNNMAASNQISQFSSSWGWGGGPSTTTDNIFKEMAAQGQSFFSAAGDSDAFTTGAGSVNGADNSSLANTPSSSPYITVVGGTTLTTTGPGGAWSAETVWNWGLRDGSYKGTSGGISSSYGIPAWQANVSMTANGGSSTHRNIPDVALTGDNILVEYGNGTSGTFGGTSCAAPLWAGLAALINAQSLLNGRSNIGFVNPAIYAIGLGGSYNANFHDISTGNNESSSSPSAFSAVTGYDLCSGWGTPIGSSLINTLAGPLDPLGILTANSFLSNGEVGGPFTENSAIFTLTNSGPGFLNWSAGGNPPWLTLLPPVGTLLPNGSGLVSASLNAAANVLPAGTYTGNLEFTNLATGNLQAVPYRLMIGQNLVANGGFETGDFTDWTLTGTSNSGQTIYNAVESTASYAGAVHSGTYGAFLGDVQPATLTQNLATKSGHAYLLSLWLANPTGGSGQQFAISWITNAASPTKIYSAANPPAFTWTNLSFVLTATGTNTVLQFSAENPPNYFGLDDVGVTPIPQPTITAATRIGNALNLKLNTVPGINYQVLYATNLNQLNWTVLSTNTASNVTLSITNYPGTNQQGFYRIRQVP